MTGLPYTEADLRKEAARHLDMSGDSLTIVSAMAEEEPWHSLPTEDFNVAFGKVMDLITQAASLDYWAVAMGADDLEPVEEFIDFGRHDGKIGGRLHLALHHDMPAELRQRVIDDLRKGMAGDAS